jgi:hypothetical protein
LNLIFESSRFNGIIQFYINLYPNEEENSNDANPD